MNVRCFPFLLMAFFVVGLGVASTSFAQTLPGSADVSRIRPADNIPVPDHSQDHVVSEPQIFPSTPAPEGAKTIHLVLKGVDIEGSTVYSNESFKPLYASLIGPDITLDAAWHIADQITQRYRNDGYFLSRAFVPQQNIKNGVITIKIIEGYISQIDLPEGFKEPGVLKSYLDRILALKPAKASDIESALLRINDLPGYSFRTVLSPIGDANDGAVKMTLVQTEKHATGSIGYDNYSSRYLGPNEASASYSTSFIPLQQTTFIGQTSIPTDKMQYGSLDHKITVAPDTYIELGGGITRAYPGYTLRDYDIRSLASSESAAVNYQWIRQRQENVSFKFTLDNRDVASDLLGAPLTRDHIHAARASSTFDLYDDWNGYNTGALTLSQGISGLGNSEKNDPYLSRSGAIPDFSKIELFFSRQQALNNSWSALASGYGQWASGRLYSSEQFGYGGQAFGRAFDASELTGDQGMSGSLEIRYENWTTLEMVAPQPYAFYDIGTVWNAVPGEPANTTGSSAGLGVRFTTDWHQTGNLGLAFPVGRNIETPIYGTSASGPRIMLQISQNF